MLVAERVVFLLVFSEKLKHELPSDRLERRKGGDGDIFTGMLWVYYQRYFQRSCGLAEEKGSIFSRQTHPLFFCANE